MTDWVSEWGTDWLTDRHPSLAHPALRVVLVNLFTFFHFLIYLQRPPPPPPRSNFLTFYFPFYFRVCSSSSWHTHTYMWKILILLASASAAAHSANVSEPVKCLSEAEVPDIPEQLAHASAHLPPWPASPSPPQTDWLRVKHFEWLYRVFFIYFIAAAFTCLPRCCCCCCCCWYFMSIALRLADLCRLPPSGNCLPPAPPLYPSGCCLKAA